LYYYAARTTRSKDIARAYSTMSVFLGGPRGGKTKFDLDDHRAWSYYQQARKLFHSTYARLDKLCDSNDRTVALRSELNFGLLAGDDGPRESRAIPRLKSHLRG
jgi:hypothetical protein